MMNRRKRSKEVEQAVFAAERAPGAVVPTDEWQRQVMARVRQASRAAPEIIEFPVWRFAWVTAAAAVAALCFGVWFIETDLLLDSMTVDIAGGLTQVVSSL
ncbi:MAG: hypothetical protein K9M45_11790 [Kiritimatiellales bacterium]|nr:hypothetical protein [Kiritimatiellales bacterium]